MSERHDEAIDALRQAAQALRVFAANVDALAEVLADISEGDAECERAIVAFARRFADTRDPFPAIPPEG
jgi:hypothetical protein